MLIWHCHTVVLLERFCFATADTSLHLSAAHGRDRFETRCLILSMGLVERKQCIGNTSLGQPFDILSC